MRLFTRGGGGAMHLFLFALFFSIILSQLTKKLVPQISTEHQHADEDPGIAERRCIREGKAMQESLESCPGPSLFTFSRSSFIFREGGFRGRYYTRPE